MNKGFRFFLSLVLVAALVCGMAGSFAEGTLDTLLPDVSLEEGSVLDSISVPDIVTEEENQAYTAGSIVTFGRYPQTEEGTDETPIEWIVLEVDEENHRALLISKYALDVQPYNTRNTDVTWENCSLRSWLNQDFLSKAFSREEQDAILLTDVDNSDTQGYSEWNTTGGNNTQDKIFLLSYAETNRYLNVTYNDSNNTASRIAPTAYAIKQGAYMSGLNKTADGSAAGWWWLRSPGNYPDRAAAVYYDGSLYCNNVHGVLGCVRPAFWINLESDTGAAGETSAEVSATESTDDLDVLLPGLNLEGGPVLEDISLPGADTTEENPAYIAGSIVTFGRYPQTLMGMDQTPIVWRVVKVDEENRRALLVSIYGLDVKPYNTEDMDVTWETCSLRVWLNDDFLNRAFTPEEQSSILLTDVDNSSSRGVDTWHTSGGYNTQDRIFLLSYAEARWYFSLVVSRPSGSAQNIPSQIAATDYAMGKGASTGISKTADGNAAVMWWLRSPGHVQNFAASVGNGGSLINKCVIEGGICVRPAMWVSLPETGTTEDASAEEPASEGIGDVEALLPGLNLGDSSVLDGISLPDAEATSETRAEEPAAEASVEGAGDPETLLPGLNLGDGSVLEGISLPDAGTEEENPVYTAGSIVTFGRYPQTEKGTDETPIEWVVLEVDAKNHRALLLSKYGLDKLMYNTERKSVTWEDCTLRHWLNQDFLNRAFTPQEQAAILLTDVNNSFSQGYSGWEKTSGGNDTRDRIFLLSCAEVKRYFNVEHESVQGSFQNTISRVAPTPYAIRQGAWTDSNYKTSDGSLAVWWWLRSPGSRQNCAAGVSHEGALKNYYVDSENVFLRPAMWVDLNALPSAP